MPIDIPPPPAFVQPVAAAPSPMVPSIRSYAAGPARCGGETVTPLRVVDPVPDGMVLPPQGSSAASRVQAPVTLAFEVDSEGRPVGIARAPENNWMADDVEPAFAAWRFPAGAPRRHCTIRFDIRDMAVAEAEASLLHAYLATRASRLFRHSPPEVSRAAEARGRPAGSTCTPRPGARLWAMPDFDSIPQEQGRIGWNRLAFDVDGRGRAANIRLLGSSGNADLDRKSVAALRQSRFTRPARGCTYNFYRNPARPTPPPAAPVSLAAYRTDTATCDPPQEQHSEERGWLSLAPLNYPENFRRRGIEGWAIIRYDFAPWGQTGNVSVVEAQPASGFGAMAKSIVERSRRRPAGYGGTGCLELVRFRMPPAEPAAAEE